MDEGRSSFKILTSTPTGKRPLDKPGHRWEENIRMDLKVIAVNAKNLFDWTRDRDYCRNRVYATLNFQVP